MFFWGEHTRAFLSAAKPSDLGTLGVVVVVVVVVGVVVVVVVGDHFWNLPKCSFSEVCSRVARFFNSISKPK